MTNESSQEKSEPPPENPPTTTDRRTAPLTQMIRSLSAYGRLRRLGGIWHTLVVIQTPVGLTVATVLAAHVPPLKMTGLDSP